MNTSCSCYCCPTSSTTCITHTRTHMNTHMCVRVSLCPCGDLRRFLTMWWPAVGSSPFSCFRGQTWFSGLPGIRCLFWSSLTTLLLKQTCERLWFPLGASAAVQQLNVKVERFNVRGSVVAQIRSWFGFVSITFVPHLLFSSCCERFFRFLHFQQSATQPQETQTNPLIIVKNTCVFHAAKDGGFILIIYWQHNFYRDMKPREAAARLQCWTLSDNNILSDQSRPHHSVQDQNNPSLSDTSSSFHSNL